MGTDFEVEDIRSLLLRRLEPPRFAVDGLVPRGGVTVLAGRPKHGKSWFALDLALGVGTGIAVLGDVACAKGPVLYLALEDSPYRMRGRVGAHRAWWRSDAPT
jgi:RecA-family ATPase